MEAIFLESVFLPESWKSWQIRKTLGEGSYGTVYLAEKQIGSDVSLSAIKIIRISPEENEALSLSLELGNSDLLRKYYEDITLTYIQEIKTMIALKGHPNIVYIEDYAVEADPENTTWTIFIRMEYLTPFSEYVQTHSLSESDVIRLGKDLCSALSACEKNGILHRDIKPSNIFISPATGLFKLGDFGVARKMDRTSGVYSSKGTFPYMAPEVFSGRPYDHRSDLYSLGLVLYLLLNKNREPFVDLNKQMIYVKDRENATSRRIAGEPVPPPIDASPAIAEVILKACSFNPDKRYPNADTFKAALESIQSDRKQKGRHRKTILGLSLLALLAVLFILFFPHSTGKGPEATATEIPEAQTNTDLPADTFTPIPEQTDTPVPTETPDITATPEPAATASLPSMIEIDISSAKILPIMENDRLYYHPQTHSCVLIAINSIIQTLEEAGCVFTESELETFKASLKKQFIPEGNDKLTNGEKFAEGEIIALIYRPDASFMEFLNGKGYQLKYNDQTFIVKPDDSGTRLRFEHVLP